MSRDYPLVLESMARRLFVEAWRSHSQPCPLLADVPDLLRMLDEAHDQPVEQLASAVRLRVIEGSLIRSIDHVHTEAAIDHHVQLALEALEALRHYAVEQGIWSTAPVTPLMCG